MTRAAEAESEAAARMRAEKAALIAATRLLRVSVTVSAILQRNSKRVKKIAGEAYASTRLGINEFGMPSAGHGVTQEARTRTEFSLHRR